jgi:hypothetical protein
MINLPAQNTSFREVSIVPEMGESVRVPLDFLTRLCDRRLPRDPALENAEADRQVGSVAVVMDGTAMIDAIH